MWKDLCLILISLGLCRMLINYVRWLEHNFRRDPADRYDMGGDWRDDE